MGFWSGWKKGINLGLDASPLVTTFHLSIANLPKSKSKLKKGEGKEEEDGNRRSGSARHGLGSGGFSARAPEPEPDRADNGAYPRCRDQFPILVGATADRRRGGRRHRNWSHPGSGDWRSHGNSDPTRCYSHAKSSGGWVPQSSGHGVVETSAGYPLLCLFSFEGEFLF